MDLSQVGSPLKSHRFCAGLEGISESRHVASDNQSRYVKAELSGVGTYMIAMGHVVEGPFDEAAFRSSARKLVLRHDALRTRFEVSNGVHAIVGQEAEFGCHVCQTPERDLSAFRSWALPLIFNDVDPCKPGSLIRFFAADMGSCWRFSIAGHHAITDGISRGVMNKELLEFYAGETPDAVSSYYDFVNSGGSNPGISEAINTRVQSLPKPVRLIGDGNGTSSGEFVEHDFGALQAPVKSLAKSLGTSKFGFLTAIYALGLRGFAGEDRVSSFFQSAGRRSLDAPNSVVGPFSNTLPLDLSIDMDAEFGTFACKVLAQTKDILALENEPLLDAVIEAQKSPSVSINMFPPEPQIVAGSLKVGPREFLDRRTEFDLNLVWSEDGSNLKARAFYNSAQISETRAQLFLGLQSRLLEAALENPQVTCRQLMQKARAGHHAVAPRVSLEPDPTRRLHCAFFEWAERTPDASAIRSSREEISYRRLADQARAVSASLRTAGIAAGDKVAIFAQRDPQTVAAMLGVSAHGASFALIDASYPAARIKMMMDRLETTCVIEAGATLPSELVDDFDCIPLLPAGTGEPAFVDGPPRAVACHMFTSGTTGHPKLISHPDKTLQRFIAWQEHVLDLPERITTVMMAGLAHDPTLRDVFLPLSSGGCIAVPTPCEMSDPAALRTLIRQAGCNVVRFSTSTARLLTTGMNADETFDELRGIFWGGERLPHQTSETWRGYAPLARQFNVFGTTETPQAFLVHEIDAGRDTGRDIPIGHPLPWSGARLVDDDGSPVSVGEVGEIVAELADPVVGINRRLHDVCDGSKNAHFTGDSGYQMPDGDFYFAGRRDWQVKINGYRVELGEIETTVEAVDGVERACAIHSDEKIYLFVLSDAAAVTDGELKGVLTGALPSYMIPSQIVVADTFPYTANGKVDRDVLLKSAHELAVNRAETMPGAAPEGPLEMAIADVFAKRSGQHKPSRDQALSDLGVDSLSTIEVRLDLEKLGLKLPDGWPWKPVSELADQPTLDREYAGTLAAIAGSSRTEMFVFLRCLAIISVVAFHSGFQVSGGASIVLFVLAGYSFAQLQLPSVLKDGHAGRVWALLARLLIPLVPMSLIYLGLNAYRGVETHPSSLLFYRNLTELINGTLYQNYEKVTDLEWLWFLHAYLQIFLLFGLLLSFSAIRRFLSADLWRGLAIFFVAAEGVSLLTIFGVSLLNGDFGEAAYFLHRSPVAIIPFLVIGAIVATANTVQRKAISFCLVVVHFGLNKLFYVAHEEIWWVMALGLCVLVPYVSLPNAVSKIVVTIAAYSLMIYLTHHAVNLVFYKFAGGSEAARLASMVAQISFGVAFGLAIRPFIIWLGVNRFANGKTGTGQATSEPVPIMR